MHTCTCTCTVYITHVHVHVHVCIVKNVYRQDTTYTKLMYMYIYIYKNICLDRGQSSVGSCRRTGKGAFLSSSFRFAPPRDIMLEEPDIANPGVIHCTMSCTYSIHTLIPSVSLRLNLPCNNSMYSRNPKKDVTFTVPVLPFFETEMV